jgi:hypothetical protein
MATFDVSFIRDPETGCVSSGNQIAYEECRQSYYAKQQAQKTTTTLAPGTTDPKPTATDSTLNAKVDSLQREVHQLQLQQSTPPSKSNPEQYYPHIIIVLVVVIAGMAVIQILQLKKPKKW